MRWSGKTILKIDRCFWLPHRLAEVCRNALGPGQNERHGQVLVLKFMGMGSLIQFAALCENWRVDKSKITLVTLDQHRELCELFGFNNVWFVRTQNLVAFCIDCWRVLLGTKSLQPACIVDYERCSHAVGLYRTLLAWAGRCVSISFEPGRQITTPQQIVYPVDEVNQEQLFLKGIERMQRMEIDSTQTAVVPVATKVIINIHASRYLLARRYPIEYYAQVISSLHQCDAGLEFFLTGTAAETPYTNELVEKLPGLPLRNVAGLWNLEKLTEELSSCALFITGDSGPLHLAVYLSIPTLAIWGPTQPQHFGYEAKENLTHGTMHRSCSPCLTHPASLPAKVCHGKIDCMKLLVPSLVFEKAKHVLTSQKGSHNIRFPAKMQSTILADINP